MRKTVLAFFAVAITCVLGCGENSDKVYNVRRKRDTLSENIVIGMDYFGKPKIVCHCDAAGVQRLQSRSILASKRDHVVKVKQQSLKSEHKKGEMKTKKKFAKSEDEKSRQRDLIYSPTCCKIDLTNPRKLYSYPFTLRLPDLTFTDTLADASSQEYQDLKKQLTSGLTTLLANEGCVVSINVAKIRNGSVLADVVLLVQGMISQSIIDTLKSAIDSGNIGGLRVEIVPDLPPNEQPKTTPKPSGSTAKPSSPTPTKSKTTPSSAKSKTTPSSAKSKTTPSSAKSKTTPKPTTKTTSAVIADENKKPTTTPKPTPTPKGKPTTPKSSVVATIAPTTKAPTTKAPTTKAPTTKAPTTPRPVTTPAPVMTPETPVDSRPTLPYSPGTAGKDFKVAIILTEKTFDANLNVPSSLQYLELKKMIEDSLSEIFRGNAEFTSVTVLGFRPAVYKPPKTTAAAVVKPARRSNVPLLGVEVTLEFKFRVARPGLLTPLETQLKVGTIASHKVSPNMAAVIIKEETCPSTCRQPSVCFPTCSSACCSAPPTPPCPSPCPSKCAPSCTSACCSAPPTPPCPSPCPSKCAPSCTSACCSLTRRSYLFF